jgi:hypothetical protein
MVSSRHVQTMWIVFNDLRQGIAARQSAPTSLNACCRMACCATARKCPRGEQTQVIDSLA